MPAVARAPQPSFTMVAQSIRSRLWRRTLGIRAMQLDHLGQSTFELDVRAKVRIGILGLIQTRATEALRWA